MHAVGLFHLIPQCVGRSKLKTGCSYIVVIPRTINSDCPVDINGHSTHQVVYSKHTYMHSKA